jgi:hypothetical protein
MNHSSQLSQARIKSSQKHLKNKESKSKTHRADSNIDTINKWRQVINGVSKGD